MSVHKLHIEFTEPAESDFQELLSFTLLKWGQQQLAEYSRNINDALNSIALNPQLGRKKYGIMVYNAGKHRIFYRIENDWVYILRILHERMDAVRYLPET